MDIPINEAEGALDALVRRAQAGEEVVLLLEGSPAVRLEPVRRALTPEERGKVLEEVMAHADRVRTPGPSSAELQASLYDEDGLPA